MKSVNRRIANIALMFIPLLVTPACCLTPQLIDSIGDTTSDVRIGICDPVGDTARAIGTGGLALAQITLLPVAIAADVVIVPPVTLIWIVVTAGGHGSSPFGCR